MASTRTPATGTIKISDLDKSITKGWTTNNTQRLSKLEGQDFYDGDPTLQDIGFAYCYGSPGIGTPHNLSSYYNIIGWVDYRCTTNNLAMFGSGGGLIVNINPMNGSNGTAPQSIAMLEPGQIPFGSAVEEGAHWETLQIQVEVFGMTSKSFDVFFEGNYIDTITGDGLYVYDNGSVGYTNGPGDTVDIEFVG